MQLKYYLFLSLSLCIGCLKAQVVTSPQISILTISPGKDLYSVFGHTAIRVRDNNSSRDLVFDFGTFDFDTPGFYLKFIRGKLDYALSVRPFDHFKQPYLITGQSVYEQVLDLTPTQAQYINNKLIENYRPENRFYPYDFFFDNCATRITDLLENTFDHQLSLDSTLFQSQSFRELLKPYLQNQPWTQLGINLILGLKADQEATIYQQTFLPDNLRLFLDAASISEGRPLVKQEQFIMPLKKEKFSPSTSPIWFFFGLLLIIILAIPFEISGKIALKVIDFLLFAFTGLAGCLFLFMWLGTDHLATHRNLDLMWAWPTHLIFAFGFLGNTKLNSWRKIYLSLFIISIVVFQFWPVSWSIRIFCIILGLRVVFHLIRSNSNTD